MRVVVLCRKLNGRPTDGFERYSNDLVTGLRGRVEVVLPNQDAPGNIPPSGSFISPLFYDIAHPIWEILRGRMKADVFHAVTDAQAIIFPWLRGKKVLTMHHVDKTAPDSIPETIFRTFFGIGTRIGLRQADTIICVSSQTKKEVMERYGVPASRLVVVPHAIADKFRPLPEVRKKNAIGYIGAFKRRKNLEHLVRAFDLHVRSCPQSELELVLCGDGTDRDRLEALVGELGLAGRVELRGPVPEDKLVETYNSFSMLAMTSYQEGFGLPIIEAQACGVPVLTVEGAMIPEEVIRATVKCKGLEDMAMWMDRLQNDREARGKVIAAGLAHAATFSVDRMTEATASVYAQTLKE
ncbi:MAG: glycosyltransferase family 1 protein [Methanomassiliicoccus sp.]|nr:glycosyltransferase family 1 protein [Methanomassiliicoccus sp.]